MSEDKRAALVEWLNENRWDFIGVTESDLFGPSATLDSVALADGLIEWLEGHE